MRASMSSVKTALTLLQYLSLKSTSGISRTYQHCYNHVTSYALGKRGLLKP